MSTTMTPKIIANDQGNRTTPSWVAFNETEKLVGESAKNQFNLNPNHTIFDIKRFMMHNTLKKRFHRDFGPIG